MSLQLIKKIINGLPESERKRAVVAVEGTVYTWENALAKLEEDENSPLAQKIQKMIEEMREW